MFRLIVIAFCLVAPALGYSKIAPESTCKELTPGHHADPQNSTAPYSFYGKNSIKSGEKITLSLSGDPFLGFMIQARNAEEEPIGTFKVVESEKSQLLKCSAEGDTLTHVQLHRKPIEGVQFEWLAPANFKGTVKFIATVVKDYTTFWVRKVTKEVIVE